jgi:hypothetical protein
MCQKLEVSLDFAGYYRRFIEGFSKIVKPLTSLLEKGKKFKRDAACQTCFEELKNKANYSPSADNARYPQRAQRLL